MDKQWNRDECSLQYYSLFSGDEKTKILITDHVGDCKKYNLTECRISIVYSHFHVCHMSGKYEID